MYHISQIPIASQRLTLNNELLKLKKLSGYFLAACIIILCTYINHLLFHYVDHSNLIMLYLLGTIFVATRTPGKYGPAIFSAILSTLCFDFFFTPPFYSFNVSDIQYFFTLLVMLTVTHTIIHLTICVQNQCMAARNAKEQAEAERIRNIMLTSISHDLRTPLTVIMGSASTLLQMKSTNGNVTELSKNIYLESKRLNHLVTNILQIVRLESGTVKVSKQLYAIEDIINSALGRFDEEWISRKVNVNIAQYMPLIPLDHILIEQVLNNLIDNALKYSEKNSPIEITARLKNRQALVKVGDRGVGIQSGDINNIFEKFYRVENADQTRSGFGLGLAICKHIILAHHGKIWAEQRKDGGTFFYFVLPLGDKNAKKTANYSDY